MSEMCLFCNFVVVVKFVDHESNIYTTKNWLNKLVKFYVRRLADIVVIWCNSWCFWMGQTLAVSRGKNQNGQSRSFPNLATLPPEMAQFVLSYLNATDLCLATCVWDQLGNDDILWQGSVLRMYFNFQFNMYEWNPSAIIPPPPPRTPPVFDFRKTVKMTVTL